MKISQKSSQLIQNGEKLTHMKSKKKLKTLLMPNSVNTKLCMNQDTSLKQLTIFTLNLLKTSENNSLIKKKPQDSAQLITQIGHLKIPTFVDLTKT